MTNMPMTHTGSRAVLIALLFAQTLQKDPGAGCAGAGAQRRSRAEATAPASARMLSLATAIESVRQGLTAVAEHGGTDYERRDGWDGARVPPEEINVTTTCLTFRDQGMHAQFGGPVRIVKDRVIVYRDLRYVAVEQAGSYWGLNEALTEEPALLWDSEGAARRFADGLNRLIFENSAEKIPLDAEYIHRTEALALAWRQAGGRVDLPEPARQHKVLAENAVREKDIARAIRQYEAALDLYPTWPEGEFNVALLSEASLGYRDAIRHMRCYLALTPDAADAPAARDKILIWQDKLTSEEASPVPEQVRTLRR